MSPALSMCVAVFSGARRHNIVLRSGASWLKKQHQGSVLSECDSQAALLPFIPTNLWIKSWKWRPYMLVLGVIVTAP